MPGLLPPTFLKVMKRESTIRGSRNQMSPNRNVMKEQAIMHLRPRSPQPTRTPYSSTSGTTVQVLEPVQRWVMVRPYGKTDQQAAAIGGCSPLLAERPQSMRS